MGENIDPTIAKALKSFLCFLYVGNDRPYYDATKSWKNEDLYAQGKHMRNLEILVSDKKSQLVPLDKIKLAMDSGLVRKSETLMFALAMCTRQKKSKKLRTAAYYFVTEHCKEWRDFSLFIAYTTYLCRVENPKEDENAKGPIGSGRGWKNAVNKWYLNRDAMDLAILMGRYKSAHGFKHRDILKLSHIDFLSTEVAKQVVLTYAFDGLNAAITKFEDQPDAKNQLDYLKSVGKFRTCQDPNEVAAMISNCNFTIDHVHPNALKDKIVWESLLPCMDIRSVLKYLPKIAQLGFLKKGSSLTEIIARILTDRNNLNWNKVLPAEILAVLNLYDRPPLPRYLHRGRLPNVEYEESVFKGIVGGTPAAQRIMEMCIREEQKEKEEKEKKEQEALEQKERKPAQEKQNTSKKAEKSKTKLRNTNKDEKMKKKSVTIKAPNREVRNALQTALKLSLTVDITESSEKRYVVAIKMAPLAPKEMTCPEIGLTIALPLLHRNDTPENATTIIFHDPARDYGFIPKISKDWSYDDALVDALKSKKECISLPLGPMGFCYEEKEENGKECDVFINVTNLPPTRPPIDDSVNKTSIRSLIFWKKYAPFPQTRFVNILLNKAPFELRGDEWDEILTIRGFDANVPFIIEAYVRELF